MKIVRKTKEPNGDIFVTIDNYTCSKCFTEYHESYGEIISIEDDYLCKDCVRELFFRFFDLYSIPMMPETKGLFRYTMKARGRRRGLPREISEQVFRKDKYTCVHCSCSNRKLLTVDHIHPYSKGGEDKLSNFQTLCRSCNSKKGAKV